MTPEEIAFSDAVTLGKLIAKRTISSEELTKAYLSRLEIYGASYGAVVTIMHERALHEARAADKDLAGGHVRSALHGVPYGVKDLLAAVGAPTTWGAAPYRNQVFHYDGTVVRKLKEAGAVLCAKLAMVELAGGFGYNDADASFTGPGRTPWNRAYWSGGSSSGPGAAVAAGLVGFAIGSETNGSIMVPAAFCGVSGLRPTYGRVSRHGAMALMWTSDKLGPLCRSARDAEVILKIVAGRDPNDKTSRDEAFRTVRGRKPRVAIVKNSTAKTMPAVEKNFLASLAVLREFCDVVPDVALPEGPYGAVFGAIFNGECAAAFRGLIESGRSRELQSADDRIGGYQAYGSLAVDYVDGMRRRALLNEELTRAIEPYDAIVHPTLPTLAYPVGIPFDKAYPDKYSGEVDLGSPGNLAGLPAISVPNGFGEHSLPTGLGLMGRAWSESQSDANSESVSNAHAIPLAASGPARALKQYVAILLGLCAAAFYGAADFCGGLATRRSSMFAVAIVSQAAGLILLVALMPLLPGRFTQAALAYGALGGACGGIGIVLLYHALSIGKMGVVSPITAVLAAALPVVVGVVRGDRLSAWQMTGIVVALAAVVLISLSTEPDGRFEFSTAGVREAVASGVVLGGFYIFLALAGKGAGVYPVLFARMCSVALLLAIALVLRREVLPGAPALALVLVGGLLDMSANVCYVLAAGAGYLSIAAVLTSLYPGSTVFLARFVLKERLAKVQKAGVALALAGVALIAS